MYIQKENFLRKHNQSQLNENESYKRPKKMCKTRSFGLENRFTKQVQNVV